MLRLVSRRGLCLLIIAGLGMASATLPSPAQAEKPAHAGKGNKGCGHSKHKSGNSGKAPKASSRSSGDIDIDIVFDNGAKQAVRSNYGSSYAGKSCPPGLAKKNNGCLPPGRAKKYNRGDIVQESATLCRIPGSLEVKLKLLPAGYVYRYVDGEVLVVAEAALKVIDAVVLLSRL